jgi:hypothetical protein
MKQGAFDNRDASTCRLIQRTGRLQVYQDYKTAVLRWKDLTGCFHKLWSLANFYVFHLRLPEEWKVEKWECSWWPSLRSWPTTTTAFSIMPHYDWQHSSLYYSVYHDKSEHEHHHCCYFNILYTESCSSTRNSHTQKHSLLDKIRCNRRILPVYFRECNQSHWPMYFGAEIPRHDWLYSSQLNVILCNTGLPGRQAGLSGIIIY